MATSINGVVMTTNKDVFAVVAAVSRALDHALMEGAKAKAGKTLNWFEMRGAGFHQDAPTMSGANRHVTLNLTFDGDKRTVWLFFGCDSDYHDVLPGPKLIVSTGAWGRGLQLVETAVRALADLGPAYVSHFDGDAFQPLGVGAAKQAA